MKLSDAFKGISTSKFYKICGYKYGSFSQYGHDDLPFNRLPPNMQFYYIRYLLNLYSIQKMVYCYDIEFIDLQLKKAGVKRAAFYQRCGLPATFGRTLHINYKRDERLMAIRCGLIDMINRMFEYVLKKPAG